MTRRSDMMCEDLFGCTHDPETPIVENGEISYWVCRCGQRAKSHADDCAAVQSPAGAPCDCLFGRSASG